MEKIITHIVINPSLPSAGQKTNKKEQIVTRNTCNLLISLEGGFGKINVVTHRLKYILDRLLSSGNIERCLSER
jgi:hypothetical protein